jgi:seryl-tRNA synthetase
VIKTWAPEDRKAEFKQDAIPHHGVLARLAGYDPERGTKIVGHRGYCLTGYGVFLNQALINYGLEFLFNKGFTPNQPPFFMLRYALTIPLHARHILTSTEGIRWPRQRNCLTSTKR